MRKILIYVLIILLSSPAYSFAISIGGAETTGRGKFSIGLDSEYIFKRDFKKRVFDTGPIGINYELTPEAYDNFRETVKISYGLLDFLDIYVKVGLEAKPTFHQTIDGYIPGFGNLFLAAKPTLNGGNAFVYGLGLKGAYTFPMDWIVGCDAQYIRYRSRYESWGNYSIQVIGPIDNLIRGTITYSEWHVAPYIGKKIWNFVPYVGARYSRAELRDKIENMGDNIPFAQGAKYHAKHNIGYFTGLDYHLSDNWRLNIEGRFVDELAMSTGINYKF